MIPTPKQQVILIIDDNATNLNIVMEHLDAYGFDVLIARNGESGIERARLAQPDLILLDVQMPGIDGFETCRRLKAIPQTALIPIIFMTVLSDPVDKVKGLESGAVDFISKPIDVTEMLARVKTHLALRSLQEQLRQQNEQLEERVRERTATLEAEKAQKDNLLNLVQKQSEQLRDLTQMLIQTQQQQNAAMAQTLHEQVSQKLKVLASHLQTMEQLVTEPTASPHIFELLLTQITGIQSMVQHIQQEMDGVTDDLAQNALEKQGLLADPLLQLSTREHEVLQLTVDGKTNGEIADLLVISRATVSTYRRRIMTKLNVPDLPSLIRFAFDNNLVS